MNTQVQTLEKSLPQNSLKMRNGMLLAAIGASLIWCAATARAAEEGAAPRTRASKQESIGVTSGFAVGAVAAGPLGAIIGGAAGGWLGDRFHRQQVVNRQLAGDQARLTRDLDGLKTSLAQTEERRAHLSETLRAADSIETEVSFRTNDSSVGPDSVPALLKLGALAAALPDVTVRVDGYADPRGAAELNETLAQRRAETVAEVLAGAGLSRDRIVVAGHGSCESKSAPGDLDGYALDRRVTVRLENSQVARTPPNELGAVASTK